MIFYVSRLPNTDMYNGQVHIEISTLIEGRVLVGELIASTLDGSLSFVADSCFLNAVPFLSLINNTSNIDTCVIVNPTAAMQGSLVENTNFDVLMNVLFSEHIVVQLSEDFTTAFVAHNGESLNIEVPFSFSEEFNSLMQALMSANIDDINITIGHDFTTAANYVEIATIKGFLVISSLLNSCLQFAESNAMQAQLSSETITTSILNSGQPMELKGDMSLSDDINTITTIGVILPQTQMMYASAVSAKVEITRKARLSDFTEDSLADMANNKIQDFLYYTT